MVGKQIRENSREFAATIEYMKYLVLCMFCCVLFAFQGYAQGSVVTTSPVSMMITTPVDYHSIFSRHFDFNIPVNQSLMSQSTGMNKFPSMDHLPSVFCKLENKIETKSKLAPRFRLGSLAYTEWMEGKRAFY